MSERGTSQERDTRFFGYGDHVGSGVEYAPARWTGGEVVTDPTFVTKSLKPKRFYYSPIGDGVVAADGVEMKYAPRNTEPQITVIQQRMVEKSGPAQAGLRVIEKKWSEGGSGGTNSESTKLGKTNGFPSENADANAGGRVPYAQNGVAAQSAPNYQQQQQQPQQQSQTMQPRYNNAEPFQAQKATAAPSQQKTPGGGLQSQPQAQPQSQKYTTPLGINTSSAPYGNSGGGASAQNTPNQFTPFSNTTSPLGANRSYTGTPNSVKSFNTSSSLYEPGMRYEIKKDYLVSNPRELIHQYATTTPINAIPGAEHTTTTEITKQTYQSSVEETRIGPLPPYTAGAHVPNPNKFVRQLRDETMTATQRQANQNQQSFTQPKDAYNVQKVEEIRRQTTRHFSPNSEEIDSLTSRLVTGLNTNKHY